MTRHFVCRAVPESRSAYDAFNNQTQHQYSHFTRNGTVNLGYTNNRITDWGVNQAAVYDADGNLTTNEPSSPNKNYKYDAGNRMSGSYHQYYDSAQEKLFENIETLTYDGTGLLVKTATSHKENDDDPELEATFSIRSSVMQGEVVSTVNQAGGGLTATYIRAAGTVVAVEREFGGPAYMHKAPMMNTMRATNSSGQVIAYGNGADDFQPHELDPSGKSIGFDDPYSQGVPDPQPELFQVFESYGEMINGQWTTVTRDGIQIPIGVFRAYFDGKELAAVGWMRTLSAMNTHVRIKGPDGLDRTFPSTHVPSHLLRPWNTFDYLYAINWSVSSLFALQSRQEGASSLNEPTDCDTFAAKAEELAKNHRLHLERPGSLSGCSPAIHG